MRRGLFLSALLSISLLFTMYGCAPGPHIVTGNMYEDNIEAAESLWQQGRRIEAVQLYGRVWQMSPYDVGALIVWADRSAQIGNLKWSANFYERARIAAQNDPAALRQIYGGLAHTWRLAGNPARAAYYDRLAAGLPRATPPPPRPGTRPLAPPEYREPIPPQPSRGPAFVPEPSYFPEGAPGPGPDPIVERTTPTPGPALREERAVIAPEPSPLGPSPARPAPEPAPPSVVQIKKPDSAVITEVSGNEVTLNVGSAAGVRFGDRLKVVNDAGAELGEIEITKVMPNSAVGRIGYKKDQIRPFDRVRVR